MKLLIYTSEYSGHDSAFQPDVDRIIKSAQRNNVPAGISGVMFVQRRRFLQFLEGEATDVDELYRRISQDSRHTNLNVLWDTKVPERGFSEWSMQKFSLDESVELNVEYLELIRDSYRAMLTPRTDDLVDIYRDFLDDSQVTASGSFEG